MKIILENAELIYYENFYSSEESKKIFKDLRESLAWKQDKIKLFGKTHDVPRLQAWYGDKDKNYSYSGIKMNPNDWTNSLLQLRLDIEQKTGAKFNSVLANLYRNGNDSNGWHADDEKELGKNPVIASLSFGESRKFKMKHKSAKDLKYDIVLKDGSLLLMKGTTQHFWKHTITKTKHRIGERINLTFRLVY